MPAPADTVADLGMTPREDEMENRPGVVPAAAGVPGAAPADGSGMTLSRAEQLRRHGLLQDLIGEHGLDGLIVVANDYRGHKGTLRWVTDYNLDHRHGFAFVGRDREPELVLPLNLAHNVASQGWTTPVRYHRRAVEGCWRRSASCPRSGGSASSGATRSCASPTPSS